RVLFRSGPLNRARIPNEIRQQEELIRHEMQLMTLLQKHQSLIHSLAIYTKIHCSIKVVKSSYLLTHSLLVAAHVASSEYLLNQAVLFCMFHYLFSIHLAIYMPLLFASLSAQNSYSSF